MYRKGCEGCYYWKPLNRAIDAVCCCHYMIIEEVQRGCESGSGCSQRLELDVESARIKDKKYWDRAFNPPHKR